MNTEIWGAPRRQAVAVLAGGTLLSLWIIWAGYTTKDAEGVLLCAFAGGVGLTFAAPFWALFRGRLPLWVALLPVAAALYGVLEFNAWAEETAQAHTVHPHFYDYWGFLLFSVPGIAALLRDNRQRKSHGRHHQTGNPPSPPVV